MMMRTEWGWRRWGAMLSPRRRTQTRPPHARGFGKLVMVSLTAVYLFWLTYRLLLQPQWVGYLPDLVRELLILTEVAGGLTLGLVWGVLWWRQRETPPLREARPATTRDDYYELSPREFEDFVAHLFRRKGYRVYQRGRSGDLGVDLEVVNQRGRKAVVQCKRYQSTVGPEIVRELFGTMVHEMAHHGFLVTTADISDSARAWAADKPMTLIDGRELERVTAVLGVAALPAH